MKTKKTYDQILKTSSIMGGSAALVMLLGMIRIKFAAVIIGSTGVGLLAGFTAIQGFAGTIVGLGIPTSAVREIANASTQGDERRIGEVVLTLRRVCLLIGVIGMVLIMILSPLLSRLTFNTENYKLDIGTLGIVILLANLSSVHLALLQGTRCIANIARINILSTLFSTILAIGFFYFFGLRGIVPSLLGITGTQLLFGWYYARKVPVPQVTLTWMQTYREASGLVKLGFVFMWNGLMLSAVSYFTIALITHEANLHAVGIYSAAFSLSGVFVNFVLSSMGVDYYPRLVGVTQDKMVINRLANEQTEIGLLLALPGLIATMALASQLLDVFYSKNFINSIELIQWNLLGCLFRVISWPLGFVIMALGKGRWYLLTETSYNIAHLLLIFIGLKSFGVEGVAIAFFVSSFGYMVIVYLVCNHLTGFRWSIPCSKLMYYTIPIFAITFVICRTLEDLSGTLFGLTITIVLGLFCLREILRRTSSQNRIVQVISKLLRS